jgi:hypothetical protein
MVPETTETTKISTLNAKSAADVLDFPPKKDTAIQFLERMMPPDEFGTVVAIDPTKEAGELGQIEGRAYTRDTVTSVAKFIAEHGAKKHNIYWSVNPTTKRLDKKPKKADIAKLVRLHCDIDNPSLETLAKLQSYPVPPTDIIFSGHGWWGIWQLREAIHVNNNIAELESYNAQIALDLKADHCQNIDRIARLPGTVNWPTKTKREKGLTEPVEAYIEESHPERVYALADFGEPSEQAKAIANGTAQSKSRKVPKTTASADAKETDRSRALMREVTKAVHGGKSDQAIHADFDSHAHAADQADPQRAVQRCINKAREQALVDSKEEQGALEELNAENAVVS